MVNDAISSLITVVEGNGSIIFATSNSDDSGKHRTVNIGISNNGDMGSVSNIANVVDDLGAMSSVWGNLQGQNNSIEGELVLANIGYSSDGSMSSLSADFYQDFEDHMDELEEYDVAYLLKAEFKK